MTNTKVEAFRCLFVCLSLIAAHAGVIYERLSFSEDLCVDDVRLIVPNTTTRSLSLLIALHGSGGKAKDMEDYLMTGADESSGKIVVYDRFDAEALVEKHGVILAFPNGHKSECKFFGQTLGKFWYASSGCCSCFHVGVCDQEDERMQTDSEYIRALAIKLYSRYEEKLDPRRLFVYGYSNGGFLAQVG